jgi:hypothetical protein
MADFLIARRCTAYGETRTETTARHWWARASIALATACYGISVNGSSGHDENDVLYIAFPGADAVPGKNGAEWDAQHYSAFESSIQALGNKLVARV